MPLVNPDKNPHTVATKCSMNGFLSRYSRPHVQGIMFMSAKIRTRSVIWTLISISLVILIWVSGFAPRIQGDDTIYIMLGKSLVQRSDMVALHVVGEPPWSHQPIVPLLLALVTFFWPDYPENLPAMVAMGAVIPGVLLLVFAWRYYQRQPGIGDTLRRWVWILMATNFVLLPFVVQYAMTEAWYMVFSLLAILCADEYVKEDAKTVSWLLLAASAAAAGAYLTRAVGIALLAAIPTYLLIHRFQWRKAVMFGLLSTIFITPYAYRNYTIGENPLGGRYSDLIKVRDFWGPHDNVIQSPLELFPRILNNIVDHAQTSFPELFTTIVVHPDIQLILDSNGMRAMPILLGWGTMLLAIVGFLISVRTGVRTAHVYLLLYTAMILLPAWVTVRNWVPVLPFLTLWLALGINTTIRAVGSRIGLSSNVQRTLAYSALALLLASSLIRDLGHMRRGVEFRQHGVPWEHSEMALAEASDWLQENTPEGAIVLYIQPIHQYLYAGRQTTSNLAGNDVEPISVRNPDDVMHEIYADFDYVLRSTYKDIIPGLQEAAEEPNSKLVKVYQTSTEPSVIVYQVDESTTAGN